MKRVILEQVEGRFPIFIEGDDFTIDDDFSWKRRQGFSDGRIADGEVIVIP